MRDWRTEVGPTREEINNWLDLFGETCLSPKNAEAGKNQILAYLDKLEVELAKAKGQQALNFGGELE